MTPSGKNPAPGTKFVLWLAIVTAVIASFVVIVREYFWQVSACACCCLVIVEFPPGIVFAGIAGAIMLSIAGCVFYALVQSRLPMKTPKQRFWISTLALACCLVAGAAPFWVRYVMLGDAPCGTHLRRFESEAWQAPGARTGARWEMIGDLVERVLPGKTIDEVVSILGEPGAGDRTHDPDRADRAVLGYTVRDFGLAETYVRLRFDADGRYESWSLGEGWW